MFVGRAQYQANRRYFNGEIDEIHFYGASRDELVKQGIMPAFSCELFIDILRIAMCIEQSLTKHFIN